MTILDRIGSLVAISFLTLSFSCADYADEGNGPPLEEEGYGQAPSTTETDADFEMTTAAGIFDCDPGKRRVCGICSTQGKAGDGCHACDPCGSGYTCLPACLPLSN